MVNTAWSAVWLRNFKVWRSMWIPSLLGNFCEPLFYLLALGFGLGRFVGSLAGMPYIVFLASGIICSSAMTTASFEGLYSAYTRMTSQQTWTAMLATPLDVRDIVLGEALWAGTKSLINTSAILIVAAAMGLVASWHAILALPVVLLAGATFASMALVMTAFARSYEFFLYYFTLLITPLLLLSGVFFPLSAMPPSIQIATQFFPLVHVVEIVRPLMTGGVVQQLWLHLVVILIYGGGAWTAASHFMRRRLIR